MSATPLVSVVMPLYNKRAWARRAAMSVLTQSFPNLCLVVVDDGSTDGSIESVEDLKDPRIHLVRQENAGPGAARNRGIAETGSEWLAFLDADDAWEPDYLENALGNLKRHPELQVHVAGSLWLPSAQRRLPFLPGEEPVPGPWRLPPDLDPLSFFEMFNWWSSNVVVAHRSIVIRHGGFFEKERCNSGEDQYLWLRVVLSHSVFREPRVGARVYTDASELGIGRNGMKPPSPTIMEASPILADCPLELRPALGRFLELIAYRAALRHAGACRFRVVRSLFRQYPGLRRRGCETWRLYRTLLTAPVLHTLVRPSLEWMRPRRRLHQWLAEARRQQ